MKDNKFIISVPAGRIFGKIIIEFSETEKEIFESLPDAEKISFINQWGKLEITGFKKISKEEFEKMKYIKLKRKGGK